MATPTVWIPLIIAFLGLGGGLGGVLLSQYFANRRSQRDRERDDARWQQEREREQASWAREDAARSYEYRRAAYVDFTMEFHHRHKEFIKGDEAPGDYLDALYDRLIGIQIFGTENVTQLADKAYDILVNWVYGDEETIRKAEDVLALLRSEIRRDLSIPTLARARDRTLGIGDHHAVSASSPPD
jgi:hypothetical protein